MSIWSSIASSIGGKLVDALGSSAANEIQEALRGSNPESQVANLQQIGLLPPSHGFATTSFMGDEFGTLPPLKKKRRRINPTNHRALRRALRRVEGFVKLEKRVDKIVARTARASGAARRHGFVRAGQRPRAGLPGTQVINVE